MLPVKLVQNQCNGSEGACKGSHLVDDDLARLGRTVGTEHHEEVVMVRHRFHCQLQPKKSMLQNYGCIKSAPLTLNTPRTNQL